MTPDDQVPRVLETRRLHLGLSGKLLGLTILFVMIAVVLIYVPSIASYRVNWINDRLAAAHTAALVLEAAPSGMVPESLRRQLLESIGAKSVVMKTGQQRRLLAVSENPTALQQQIDLRHVSAFGAVVGAFETMFLRKDHDLIGAVGPAPMGADFIEIVFEEGPLRDAMLTFSVNIMMVSLLISGITGMLVYFSLNFLLVRPMRRITANMTAFRENPENPARVIAATERRDEIGLAERELNAMQRDLASMLQQKSARACGIQDQSRPAQSALLGAAIFRRAFQSSRSACATVRAEADACARARNCVLRIYAFLWTGAGAPARSQAD